MSDNTTALDALLKSDINIEDDVYIRRLGANFRIRAIDGETLQDIQEQCTHYTGKGRKREKHLDEQKYGALLIAKACVDPNFNDAALKEKYGVTTAHECVRKALLAGEIGVITSAILDISGFPSDEDASEDEVKN